MNIHHQTDDSVSKGVVRVCRVLPRMGRNAPRPSFLQRLMTPAAFVCVCFVLFAAFPADASEGYISRGRASWYGTTSHGKQTANGEIYNRYALTAAHKGLPFGTVVRVYNLKNGRQTLVRINDRGPFVQGRIVDVSRRAADSLRMTAAGVVPVALEIVGNTKGEPLNANNGFYVHIANEPSALKSRYIVGALERKIGKQVRALYSQQKAQEAFALCLGPYTTFSQAQKDFLKLEQKRVHALGIIEAPADGGAIPHHSPPLQDTLRKQNNRKSETAADASLVEYLTFPRSSALYAASSLSMEKSFLFFAVVRNILAGFTGDSELFRLPYTALSGYRNSPS